MSAEDRSQATAEALLNAQNLKGIAFMAAGMFLFSATDTVAKFLTQDFHPIQVAWSRQMGLMIGVLFLVMRMGRGVFRTQHLPLQISRGVAAAGSATLFIMAVKYVPLADAVAVSFIAPFLVTILGALILKEYVGPRRWTAIAIGFIGMLIVIRPGYGVFHPAILLIVVAATLFAIRQIISRKISDTDKTPTTMAYTAFISVALLSLPLLFVWRTPDWDLKLALLISMAVLGGVAEYLVIRSLELAQAVVLAPVHYSLLLWGTFYGWLVFGQLPDGWTWLGAAIILITGIYTLHRERLAKKRAKQALHP